MTEEFVKFCEITDVSEALKKTKAIKKKRRPAKQVEEGGASPAAGGGGVPKKAAGLGAFSPVELEASPTRFVVLRGNLHFFFLSFSRRFRARENLLWSSHTHTHTDTLSIPTSVRLCLVSSRHLSRLPLLRPRRCSGASTPR